MKNIISSEIVKKIALKTEAATEFSSVAAVAVAMSVYVLFFTTSLCR